MPDPLANVRTSTQRQCLMPSARTKCARLSLIRRAWTYDAQGNLRIATAILVDRLLISSDEVEILKALRELHDQAYGTDQADDDVADESALDG